MLTTVKYIAIFLAATAFTLFSLATGLWTVWLTILLAWTGYRLLRMTYQISAN